MHRSHYFPGIALAVFCVLPLSAQMQSRLYTYTNATPAEVEAQVRRHVPEGPRVLLRPDEKQIMVIADRETHRQISRMLSRIDQPTARLLIWYRHNRDAHTLELLDGGTGTLPVSPTPPAALVEEARRRLSPGQSQLPVVGSALQVHAILLRPDPPVVRLRLTPAVTFGVTPPYEPVRFEELATDQMISTEAFVDVVDALRDNEFYARFFLTQPEPEHPPRPVGLLVSLKVLRHDTDDADP